jgi:6-phosphofructokinase 1
MKRIGVMTSGGDAPGMNAAIRAVVRSALSYDMSVIGFRRGYNGMMMRSKDSMDDFLMLTARSVSDKIHRGGTFLMTARCPEFKELEAQQRVVGNLKMLGIEGMVMIGGDGTFRGANDLDKLGFPWWAFPAPSTTTSSTPTPPSALTPPSTPPASASTASAKPATPTSAPASSPSWAGIAADIAVHTALACGAEIVLIPEVKWSIEEVAERVKWGVLKGKSSMIIVVAEGAFSSMTQRPQGHLRSQRKAVRRAGPADGFRSTGSHHRGAVGP